MTTSRAALTISELTPEAIKDLLCEGYQLLDTAGPAVAKVYGPRLQQHGDTDMIASYVGVPAATMYQWVHRYSKGGVHVASRCREVLHCREVLRARKEKATREVARELAMIAAWNAGISGTIAAQASLPRNGSSKISQLREKYGEEKVPYRSPNHWNAK